MEFELFIRDTFSKNYNFDESYMKIETWSLTSENPTFPSDIYRFLNVSQGQSASFFLFRKGVKPIYDDPEHSNGGGEFSIYFHLKNEMVKLDEALHEMMHALVTDTIIPDENKTPDLPYGDITGMSIIPKKESVTVKLWLSRRSALRTKAAVEVFSKQFMDSWKLSDAKYLSFDRPAPTYPTAASGTASATSTHSKSQASSHNGKNYHHHFRTPRTNKNH